MIIGNWRMGSLEAVANFESADRSGEDDLVERSDSLQRVHPVVAALLTLRVPRSPRSVLVGRVRVVGGIHLLSIALVNRSTIFSGLVSDRRRTSDRRKLTNTTTVGRLLVLRGVGSINLVVGLDSLSGGTLALFVTLAPSLLLLLASFPFLTNFLEFW